MPLFRNNKGRFVKNPSELQQATEEAVAELQPGKLCGSMAPGMALLLCALPRGHVRSEADWHEVKATQNIWKDSPTWQSRIDTTEINRWAPHSFEIPKTDQK